MSVTQTSISSQRLSSEQIGHLRHFDNLSRQLPNDWSHMLGKGVGQDDFGGFRFQLAYMAYAIALTHKHRLPNAPGVFKGTFQRLIDKILLPEVWMYWRDVSRGGSVFNAHLSDRLHEEWDPVVQDNIMYSAYVQSMALVYNVLFDDDRYAQPGALTFDHWSFFWGGEPKTFRYDQNSLNEHIYWQMVRNGYLGIACEPNCVFQICNQPAILGFRMHDLLTGGTTATEIIDGYEQAWRSFGRLDANGHYNMMLAEDTKAVRPNALKAPWVDAWCGALMNMWNRDFVHHNYPRQVQELLVPGSDGAVSVTFSPPMDVMGRRVVNDTCDFGWVATWAAEMGDADTLRGLLTHADRFMSPAWLDGGLYYTRNDTLTDEAGHRVVMEPLAGNALLGYARLNVPDGLWRFYNEPWDAAHFAEPALTEVDRNVDVTEAVFDRATRTLRCTVQRRDDLPGAGTAQLSRLGRTWSLRIDGRAASGDLVTTRPDRQVLLRLPDTQQHQLIFTMESWPTDGRS